MKWIIDLCEANGRLAHWRLRLLEFDLKVLYRKGAKNTIADKISRLTTCGYLDVAPDLEIPCFIVQERPEQLAVQQNCDTGSWVTNDWDLEGDPIIAHRVLAVDAAPLPEHIAPLTIEEIQVAQESDSQCRQEKSDIDKGHKYPYAIDERGLIVRVAPIDGVVQILCPAILRQKVLFRGHYTPLVGDPGITKQYSTQSRSLYWPAMLADIRQTSNECHQCARERMQLRRNAEPMKLFPARNPLEYVEIDIRGPLTESTQGHKYILVMTDRFPKMVRAVPLRSMSVLTIAKVFIRDWVFVYGPSARLLPDKGKQFTAKLLQSLCKSLRVSNLFTKTYHPQTNGQVERFNHTLLAGLRAFVGDHPQHLHEFTAPLALAYNTQVHRSTGLAPF